MERLLTGSNIRRRLPLSALSAVLLPLLLGACGHGPLLDQAADDEMVFYGPTPRIRGFDPVKAGDVASAHAISRMYEGLLQYAYLERPYRVEPMLAEAMPEVSEDGLTYTFRIRRGIYYQDDPCFVETGGKGRELRAEDFVYSIKRVADLKNASSGYWAFNDRIVGLDEFREASAGSEPTDYDLPVEGLHAPDDYTLVLQLKRPFPQLLWILTMHYAYAVPREAVEYYDGKQGRPLFINHPVGTGPYILNSWRRNYRVEYVRNPKWAETGRVELYPTVGEPGDEERGLLEMAGMPLPFIDRIVQLVVQDDSTAWLMFLTGQFNSSGISRDNFDAVVTQAHTLDPTLVEREITLAREPTLTIFYFGFNMDDPVVGQNKKLRQALTSALNTEEWVRFHNNRITRPAGPIPPGIAGYSEKESPFPFDLDRARELLAEAGYPNGIDPETGRRLQLTIDLGSAESAEVRQSVELFTSFMDRIGVVIVPTYNNWPAFLEKLERRQMQIFRLGWVADYPDAENFLQLFYGPNGSPGPNHSNYRNPEFDALYEEARVMHDSPERTALYRAMAEIVMEDCPWIFDAQPLSYSLTHSWVRNFKAHDFPYGMIKHYYIDNDIRRAWQARFAR